MWIFTPDGFYSVVQDKINKDQMWIRTRDREDLVRLITKYNISASPILEDYGTDYKFRVTVWRQEWVRVAAALAGDIDYNNFKHESEIQRGAIRASILCEIWWVLMSRLQLGMPPSDINWGTVPVEPRQTFDKPRRNFRR